MPLSKANLHWFLLNLTQVILTLCFIQFQSSKRSCTHTMKISSSKACTVRPKGERWWKREGQNHWLPLFFGGWGEGGSPAVIPPMALSRSMPVSLGITVFWMWQWPVSHGNWILLCWRMLNGAHAETLNASTSMCFARATQCHRLYGSALGSATVLCTKLSRETDSS